MSVRKYLPNQRGVTHRNGSQGWHCRLFGAGGMGVLAEIHNCPTPFGSRKVYIQGEPDTVWTTPAAIEFRRRKINGYVTCDENGYKFNCYSDGAESVFPSTETEDPEGVLRLKQLRLRRLKATARSKATQLGHRLRPWLQNITNHNSYSSDCRDCDMMIAIVLRDEKPIIGRAALDGCTKHLAKN